MQPKETFSEGLTDLLIATLGSARSTHRFKKILFERKLKRYKKESVSVALSRLNSKGFVNNSKSGWTLTTKGRVLFKKNQLLSFIPSPFKDDEKSNTIISFDIPEHNRVLRNWLRNQIKIFGYKMLQQSLWLGQGPLPAEFTQRLNDLGIKKYIKIFKVTKSKT